MKRGDAVDVRQPWAARGNGLPPIFDWFAGYVFEGAEPAGTVLVRGTVGPLVGPLIRYERRDVRPSAGEGVRAP